MWVLIIHRVVAPEPVVIPAPYYATEADCRAALEVTERYVERAYDGVRFRLTCVEADARP